LSGEEHGSDFKVKATTYNEVRGSSDGDSISWPATKYRVADGSLAAKLRAKAHGTLLIDLPEEEQWEAAARAGSTTLWPNGGTADDPYESLTNYINEIAIWSGGVKDPPATYTVGSRSPSGFGLYDVIGLGHTEWTLDSGVARINSSVPRFGLSNSTDPVGAAFDGKRIIRSQSGSEATPYSMGMAIRQLMLPTYGGATARFAIHLKPLNFEN
jgi:formylglycine-generating enzyme required for sulfatase activity